MFNKAMRIVSLLLALVMIFSLTACKSKEENTSDETEIVYEYEYEYEDEQGDGTTGTSSGKKPTSSANKEEEMTGTTVNLDKLKGTTVVYATWHDPELNEDGPVVQDFQKKYGINVKIDYIEQGGYVRTVASRIAAGQSPDVYFCTGDFPAAMQCLQSLDATKLDLTDEIWNKTILDVSTYGGKPYLLDTVGDIWAETDCIFYNKKILKQAGFSEVYPNELYEQGKWTWDSMEHIMRECSKLGGGISGAEFYLIDSLANSVGCGMLRNKNGKFSSGIDNKLIEVYKRIASWHTDGLSGKNKWDDGFIAGKVAFVHSNAYGLKQTGHWRDMNWDDIGFVYAPAYDSNSPVYQSALIRGYGLIRGAKNPEGAGVFLRYYLDADNYDNSSAFINDEAATFFYQLTNVGENYVPYFTFHDYIKDLTGFDTKAFMKIPTKVAPDQVESSVKSFEREANNAVKTINDFTAKNTGKK